MRYILSDEGYIETISFDYQVECNNKSCTEYTGTVPEGYSSLAEWSENAVIQAYKITNGNLTHDPDKETDLLNEWEKQTGQKILWEGQMYMNEVQEIDLSKTPISSQPNGIVLVFSAYSNNAPQNWDFKQFFISKKSVELINGAGYDFILNSKDFGKVAAKYLYIAKDKISGHANNTVSGTGASGIKYTNNAWVLRYVIGV